MVKRHFDKMYESPEKLVKLMTQRGLQINDEAKAQRCVECIGYYRLSAYMHPFLLAPKSQHQFKEGASFDKVMNLYRFDKKLRILIFNEVEKEPNRFGNRLTYNISCTYRNFLQKTQDALVFNQSTRNPRIAT